jgi:hypothetical protein
VLADDAKGMHNNHTTYNDTNVEQIKSIPKDALHRNVDLELMKADEEGTSCIFNLSHPSSSWVSLGYVRIYIILPSTIYGLATGPIFSENLANPHSVQIPTLIKSSIDRGRAGMIGNGLNVWPHVHIDDIADLFLIVFNTILVDPEKPGHGWEGFYLGENGSYTYGEIEEEIGKVLVKLGKSKPGEEKPTPYTKEEIDKYFGGVCSHPLVYVEVQRYSLLLIERVSGQ